MLWLLLLISLLDAVVLGMIVDNLLLIFVMGLGEWLLVSVFRFIVVLVSSWMFVAWMLGYGVDWCVCLNLTNSVATFSS